MAVAVFIDTNYFLHYPPPSETDWCAFLKEKSVRLVVCLAVIDELDAKKDHPTLGDRAASRIKFIENALGRMAMGVTLELFVDDAPDEIADDRSITAQVIRFKAKNPSLKTVVLSEDMGMRLRCKSSGIETIEPLKDKRLENPLNDLQKENVTLKRQLAQVTQKQPEIVLYIDDTAVEDGKTFVFEVTTPKQTFTTMKQAFADRIHGNRYVAEDTLYLIAVDKHLARLANVDDESHRTFDMTMEIKNVGGAPAKGVTVSLTFPKSVYAAACYGFSLFGARTIPERGIPVSRDRKDYLQRIDVLTRPHNLDLLGSPFTSLGYKFLDNRLELNYPMMEHDYAEVLQSLSITLAKWPDASTGVAQSEIKVKIHTIDPPDSKTMNVQFVVKVKPPDAA